MQSHHEEANRTPFLEKANALRLRAEEHLSVLGSLSPPALVALRVARPLRR
jgi:hypothetical protein